jgi:Holliday junction resolvase RusA-like endonuclease
MSDPRIVEFVVMGEPITEGSYKAFAFRGKDKKLHSNVTHQNAKGINKIRKDYRTEIEELHEMFYTENKDIGFFIDVTYYVSKGKSVKRPFPTVRGTGDIDKLLRCTLDAITYDDKKNKVGLFSDDSAVIGVTMWKFYTDDDNPEPKTRIKLIKLLMPDFVKMKQEEQKKMIENLLLAMDR